MKNAKLAPLLLIAIAVIAIVILANFNKVHAPSNTKNVKIKNAVIFPKAGAKLVKGKTYNLEWTKTSGKTDIFLINRSLESEGVSVSIADRIYNIENSGFYPYKIPTNIPDGVYKLTIGSLNSGYFDIASK